MLFPTLNLLHIYINTFQSMRNARPVRLFS